MVSEEELKNMSPEEIRKLQEQNCIFCKISKKEIPSKIVYEDDIVCAFLDIQPLTMGHTIIIPKKHNVFFSQVNDDDTKHIFKVVRDISQSILKALQAEGTNIYIANGEAAGQFAPHMMIHVIPRKEGEDVPAFHPLKEKYGTDILSKVQKALVSRIEEVMGIELKSKLIEQEEGKGQDQKVKEPEKENKDDIKQSNQDIDTGKSENEKRRPREDDEEEKPEKAKRDKKDDVNLDKISELFK